MHLICKDCKEDPPNLVEDFAAGDTICASCGLVLGDRIVDTRSEWRTFTNDDQNTDDPSRVGDGANPLLNGAQLQTGIAFGGANGKSRDLSRAQNKVTHDKSTKVLLAAYKEIAALCDGMGIPKNVSDTAKHLFKIVNDENAFRGKSQETVVAGCIFIACRQCKVGRSFQEIFALTKVSKPEIGRIFKALEKFFLARNEKMKEAIQEAGGTICVVRPLQYYYLLTGTPKALPTSMALASRPSTRLQQRSFASGTAIDSASPRSALCCLRTLRSRSTRRGFWRVDHPSPWQLRASTWPHGSLVKGNPQRTCQILQVSAMEPFATPTSSCTRARTTLSRPTGSRMGEQTSKDYLPLEIIQQIVNYTEPMGHLSSWPPDCRMGSIVP